MGIRNYFYGRVSSKDQNENRQLDAIKKLDIDSRDVYMDKASGKDFDRPEWNALKRSIRSGDVLFIKSIDRLGRNLYDILTTLELFKEKGVTVATCPASNLKLGSGVANVPLMLKKGVNVALGTDGSASNNNLNMFKDLYLLSIISKGVYHDPTLIPTYTALKIATVNGAASQGRNDCGLVKTGYKADLIVLDMDTEHTVPSHDELANVVFSSQGSDVVLTMVDGKVLYKNGEYTTIDIEKVKYEAEKSAYRISGELK